MSILRKNRELEKLWEQMVQLNKELSHEARKCGGRKSKHWAKLSREVIRIKTLYDRELLKGNQPTYDPNSVQSKLSAQSRALKNAMEKRDPADYHFRGDR